MKKYDTRHLEQKLLQYAEYSKVVLVPVRDGIDKYDCVAYIDSITEKGDNTNGKSNHTQH